VPENSAFQFNLFFLLAQYPRWGVLAESLDFSVGLFLLAQCSCSLPDLRSTIRRRASGPDERAILESIFNRIFNFYQAFCLKFLL
jgi:hypothetical protein